MGLFSFINDIFSSEQTKTSLVGNEHDDGFISKDLFYQVLDIDGSAILFYTKESGWLGANKHFFSLFNYKNIQYFKQKQKSIRELF